LLSQRSNLVEHEMAQPELNVTLDLSEAAATPSVATESAPPPASNGASSTHPPAGQTDESERKVLQPPVYFAEALQDAERLLKYAAEIGVDIDEDTCKAVLHARAASGLGWTEETAAKLLAALTKLATRLKPVSAESLKAYHDDTRPALRAYLRVALWLAIIIVPFSLASFITSAISDAIRTDISTANDLAVKLNAQLRAPTASTVAASAANQLPTDISQVQVITELQLFASTIRAIDARARELNVLVIPRESVPFAAIRGNPVQMHAKFELPVGLPNLAEAADQRTAVYQDVRSFAQNLLNDVSVFYSAITTCVLPVLYALLGTCAYLLRTFDRQMSTRTFTPSVANTARFLIAAIGGAVVGLFDKFTITQEASIPHLAIAFLVGYAVDVFFVFLEGLLQLFAKGNASSTLSAATSGGKS
jgi:hypothetical protein